MSFQVLQKGQKVSVKTCCNVGVVYIGQELVTLRKIWEECKTHVILNNSGQFGLQKMATFGKVFSVPIYVQLWTSNNTNTIGSIGRIYMYEVFTIYLFALRPYSPSSFGGSFWTSFHFCAWGLNIKGYNSEDYHKIWSAGLRDGFPKKN